MSTSNKSKDLSSPPRRKRPFALTSTTSKATTTATTRTKLKTSSHKETTSSAPHHGHHAVKTPNPSPPPNNNPYGRCPNVNNRYQKLNRIGEGTYGIVYRAKDLISKNIVALKRCLPHHESSDGFPLTTLREINALKELSVFDHENIVTLRDVAVSSSRSGVFLVFDYCEHDLSRLIDSHFNHHHKSPFRESEVKRLSLQLLSALSFLHERYIIHRDVKLSNLLYDNRGRLQLADFGLSRRRAAGRCCLTPNVVSLWYRPLDVLLGGEEYGEGVDCWSAGCVIAELLSGEPLMKGRNELEMVERMFELLGVPDERTWPALAKLPLIKNGSISIPSSRRSTTSGKKSLFDKFDKLTPTGLCLLSNLLKYNEDKRLTAKEALNSEYFKELPLPLSLSLMPTFPSMHNDDGERRGRKKRESRR